MSKTIYRCLECGGIFDSWKWRYDSSPGGDDESVCPLCGAVEPGATWLDIEEGEDETFNLDDNSSALG